MKDKDAILKIHLHEIVMFLYGEYWFETEWQNTIKMMDHDTLVELIYQLEENTLSEEELRKKLGLRQEE